MKRVLKVTKTEMYIVENDDRNLEMIEKDWFKNPNSPHAARDGARVGNSVEILEVEIADEWEEMQKAS